MEEIIVYEQDEEQLYQDVRAILIDARDAEIDERKKKEDI